MATADHGSDPGVAADGAAAPVTETEPDARYTFANERTFLAWTRTALAFILAGLGIVQLLPPFPGVPWGRHLLGVPLIAIGAAIAVVGYCQWAGNQRALRRGEPIRKSSLPRLLAAAIAGLAARDGGRPAAVGPAEALMPARRADPDLAPARAAEDFDPGLARERTRLAWTRTAIAFAAVGAALLKSHLVAGLTVLGLAGSSGACGTCSGTRPSPAASPPGCWASP